jgi:hypothetical protein
MTAGWRRWTLFPFLCLKKARLKTPGNSSAKIKRRSPGLVCGEPNYDELSDFVLEQEKLKNFGYYENELIFIKRFGAAVSSAESQTILDLIRLAYALYWSLAGLQLRVGKRDR